MSDTTTPTPDSAVVDAKAMREKITREIDTYKKPLEDKAIGGMVSAGLKAYLGGASAAELANGIGESAVPLAGAAALGKLEKRLHRITDKTINASMTDEQRRQLAIKDGLNKAEALAKPSFGISECLDAAKVLNSSGVNGEICGGIGVGGDILPDFKKRGAGLSIKLRF